MKLNATNYKKHLKKYFNLKVFFQKSISVFFMYEKYILSIDFYVN